MTTPNPRRAIKEARGTVPRDAPIRAWRKPGMLPRDLHDCLRLGLTLDELRASREGIVASDARREGE